MGQQVRLGIRLSKGREGRSWSTGKRGVENVDADVVEVIAVGI